MFRNLGVIAALVIFGSNVRAEDHRLFEMRVYTTHPGKLDALNARFRNHTNKIFESTVWI